MPNKMDYSKKSLLVVGTHGDEDLERATMAFMCASAASALGVKTSIFLTGNGVKLAQKNYAAKLPPVAGLASIKELMDAFVESGGKLQVCIPCRESRGIGKDQFMAGVKFVTLMDFAAQAMETDKIYTC